MNEFFLLFAFALGLGWPLGYYLAAVMHGKPMRGDRLFGWIERPIYRIIGTDPAQGMDWKAYVGAFIWSCVGLGVLTYIIFMTQAWLPFNPNEAENMSWDLALHTMVSFLTNTNQQHYSGQAQLSYLAHMCGIVTLQVLTPIIALAVVTATLRALFGGRKTEQAPANGSDKATDVDVGNYWADVIRPTLRFLMPLCFIWSLLLTSQGVPATLEGGPVVAPIDTTVELKEQKIPLGPVSPMVTIKQLGSNGGGWYGPNSSVPLESPTPFSNFLETLAIFLIPVTVAFMVGPFTGRKKFGYLVVGTMLTMSLVSAGTAVWSENFSSTNDDIAMMEGKEVRLGAAPSALWAAATTQVNNGSVNSMHDSLAPLTGGVAIVNMMINAIWGGVGCGLQQFIVFLMLAVFLSGLMTGRTPELFGRKIEAPEVKLLAVLVLLQPLMLLGLTAITMAIPAITENSNPGFHAISQVLYEYTSSFANNGSGFEGLGDDTVWWNVSCVVALLTGRFPYLALPLIAAAMMAKKRVAPEGPGTLQIETPTFGLVIIAVIIILTLLQFMPILVLGPVAEHLWLIEHLSAN